MSVADSSVQWALTKFLTYLPSSCTTSSNIPDHAFLANLLSSPLPSGIAKPQPQTMHLSSSAVDQLKEGILAAQRLRNLCEASGCVDYDEFRRMKASWEIIRAEKARVWAENAFSALRAVVEGQTPAPVAKKKPGFNHEYTPLLEKYFEFNAYPSAPDRAVLAKKCMMTPRQIEVWFQNHRNRAKKEGKTLRRLTDQPLAEATIEMSLKSLARKMPYFVVPAQERQSAKSRDSPVEVEEEVPAVVVSPLNDVTMPHIPLFSDRPKPSHAFPTAYSPSGSNPLDAQSKVYIFAAPVWRRHPASSTQRPKISIDINEFIHEFSQKLHLRAPAAEARHPLSQPWCASRVTVTCPTPHPALLRSLSSRVAQPFSISPFPEISVTSSQRAFLSPSPSSPPLTLVPPQKPNTSHSHRKIARLPKRTPTHTARRQVTPAMSEASSRSSSPSSSRASSEFSSRRRSSSSSNSSISSSNLMTPVDSYSNLPDKVYSPSLGPRYHPDIFEEPIVISSSRETILSNLPMSPPMKQ